MKNRLRMTTNTRRLVVTTNDYRKMHNAPMFRYIPYNKCIDANIRRIDMKIKIGK